MQGLVAGGFARRADAVEHLKDFAQEKGGDRGGY
jgi:hypothetical protein